MSLTSGELWQRIAASQLASPEQCRTWAAQASKGLSAAEASDGQRLATQLVAQGKLTRFQAEVLLGGSDQPLAKHDWRLLQPVHFGVKDLYDVRAVWHGWWVATKTTGGPATWLRWLDASDLQQPNIRAAHSSLNLAVRHSQVQHGHLQNVSAPVMLSGTLQLGVGPVSGKLLSARCNDQPLKWDEALAMLVQLSAALAALHTVGLVHGRVTPDRIAAGEDGQWRLLRDPLCASTLDMTDRALGVLGDKLPPSARLAHFMAPEFLVPGQAATAQTDCYALGCTVWLLLTGRVAYQAKQPEQILAAHAEEPLETKRLSGVPEPLARCILHCLAKNPAARFRDAAHLLESLQEVQRIIASPAAPRATPVVTSTNPPGAATTVLPASAAPVSNAPVSAAPVSAAPVSAAPVSTAPISAAPVSAVRRAPVTAGSRRRLPSAVRSGARGGGLRRRKTNLWLTSAIGGGAIVVLLLLLVVMNSGWNPSSLKQPGASQTVPVAPAGSAANGASTTTTSSAAPATDPRAEVFELVDDSSESLWVPPHLPQSLPLDLLPPGGQIFVSLRPARLFTQPPSKQLLRLLDADLASVWRWLGEQSGVPVEELDEVVLAAYPGQSGVPQVALRVRLKKAHVLGELKSAWKVSTETKVGDHAMLVSGERAYYVAAQPLIDSQSVADFVVGPVGLIGESVGMLGSVGPLNSQIEQLWKWSDAAADFCVIVNPSFLFTEGRGLLQQCPPRLADQLKKWLARDMRGAMLTTNLDSQWFYELRLIGSSDRDAGAIRQRMSDALAGWPQAMESWFVSESPHPYWRALALRFPNMLRALATQTRVGTENGQAIANGYLPSEAAPNLLYASWMALQPSATLPLGTVGAGGGAPATQPPLTTEQILQRPITVAVDQQGIEVVLQLIGEQANDQLPPGTKPLRFELDGAAFQRSGITRNQQIRDFNVQSQPVRTALTELARRGNPVPGVSDLKSADQKLIWVILQNAERRDEAVVSLTSREAATASNYPLPAEFAAGASSRE